MLILNRFLKCHRSAIRLPATAAGPAQDFSRGPQHAPVLRVVGWRRGPQHAPVLRVVGWRRGPQHALVLPVGGVEAWVSEANQADG
jgi:hypothetical protein